MSVRSRLAKKAIELITGRTVNEQLEKGGFPTIAAKVDHWRSASGNLATYIMNDPNASSESKDYALKVLDDLSER